MATSKITKIQGLGDNAIYSLTKSTKSGQTSVTFDMSSADRNIGIIMLTQNSRLGSIFAFGFSKNGELQTLKLFGRDDISISLSNSILTISSIEAYSSVCVTAVNPVL